MGVFWEYLSTPKTKSAKVCICGSNDVVVCSTRIFLLSYQI